MLNKIRLVLGNIELYRGSGIPMWFSKVTGEITELYNIKTLTIMMRDIIRFSDCS